MIAVESVLGVKPSDHYYFFVILSPVGAYYAAGFNPVNILVEDHYVRAIAGGTGEAKTGGNYAASLKAAQSAKKKGFDQVLWLDGATRSTSRSRFHEDSSSTTMSLSPPSHWLHFGRTRDVVINLLTPWVAL
jgi:branched-subunit amino acid aminotransferase/4-amino-4-deoxychorismate lyase